MSSPSRLLTGGGGRGAGLGGGGLLTGGGGGLLTGGGGERLGGWGRGGGGFLGGGEGGLNTDLICQTVSAPACVWVHMSVSMLLQSVFMHRYCRAHPDRACSTQQQTAGNASAAAVVGRAGIDACHASGVAVRGGSRSRGLKKQGSQEAGVSALSAASHVGCTRPRPTPACLPAH